MDTIGSSWKGTSGLLRELRYREQPFDGAQLNEAMASAKKRHDKVPNEYGFEYDVKTDINHRVMK